MVRRMVPSTVVLPIVWLLVPLCAQEAPSWRDPSLHQVQFVTVDDNVRLEVLDWGGSGRPVVLLAGLGNTAHVYDDFAPKLAAHYHVYGITRRGFGASSVPTAGYEADRLGDDVLAVFDSVKLTRPVLAGHSIAGEELSSIGSRHPDRVAGLVYLDAVYPFSFDNGKGPTMEDMNELTKKTPPLPAPSAADRASFAAFQAYSKRTMGFTYPEAEVHMQHDPTPDGSVGKLRAPPRVFLAAVAGVKKFADIRAPVLAIIADPQEEVPWVHNNDPAVRAAVQALGDFKEKMAKAFENGVPSAHVVRMPNVSHDVFLTNEADVLREMNAFIAALK
jgi:non-heme chloroperoxidase